MNSHNTPKVAICRSTYQNVNEKIEEMFGLINYVPKKDNIFIKPNIVDSESPKTGIITSPKVVEAIILYFKKYYPDSKITIGEGPAVHVGWENLMKKAQYKYLADQYDVAFANLDEVKRVEFNWSNGVLSLPKYLQTHEYINVAKMKTHMQATVSLCMKNQKGLLQKKTKKDCHRKYELFNSIKQLSEVAKPDLNIIDGIQALEGTGPLKYGDKKNVNLLVASQNIYAADNVGATIMGFDAKEIDYLPEFTEYQTCGEKLTDCIIPFKRPKLPIKAFNIFFHAAKSMCSYCGINFEHATMPSLSTVSFLLRFMACGGVFRRIDIIGGNDILDGTFDKRPERANSIICLGNCSQKFSEENNLPIIKGCPPSIQQIQDQFLKFCKDLNRK